MARVVPSFMKPKILTTRVTPMNASSCKCPSHSRSSETRKVINMVSKVTIQAPTTRVSVKA
jgi:hypothetical protein